jgi:dihydrofolate synthase/folylpolyglutamate synthase
MSEIIKNNINSEYDEIEHLLYTKHSQTKKNGIEYIRDILRKMGDPHKRMGKIIHITGTNGKGSVAYITDAILRSMGYKTALYTSPHINQLTERIKINGNDISRGKFIELFHLVSKFSDKLSFFEMMTLIAFKYFENSVDYSIIEVGIGGMHDVTNVVEDTELCFITSIGLDHTEILGPTKRDVAFQKAGIIKKNSVCVIPDLQYDLTNIIDKKCKEENARLVIVNDFFRIESFNIDKKIMRVVNQKNGFGFDMNLLGVKQTLNLSMVLTGLSEIGMRINDDVLENAMSSISINCRFEVLRKKINGREKIFVFDGAHNPEAFSVFIDNLKFFGIKDPVLVFSILLTKDHRTVLKELKDSGIFKKVIITEIQNPKKLSANFIADELSKFTSDIDITVESELDMALMNACSVSDNVCVCGSFYLVSDALKIVKESL